MCLAVAGASALLAIAAGGAHAHVVARHPAPDSATVPAGTGIHARLDIGRLSPRQEFTIAVLQDGDVIAGRSTQDGGTVSFTPDAPLPVGQYAVQVQTRSSEDAVVDAWSFTVPPAPDPAQGLGGSILLVAREQTRDAYLAEILRAEGFTGFDTVTPEQVTDDALAGHAVVLLGAGSATGPHVAALESWVRGGGDLIAMKPQGPLSQLAGLTATGETLADAYLAIDTSQPPGAGITAGPMQFHGDALVYEAAPTSRIVAALTADPQGPGALPAVTLTEVGTAGGRIAAFSYDLATSVMYTRQGDPARAGEENDALAPIRANDLFMGSDGEADYLDLSKIGIPQADEQMRLLSNVLIGLHADTSPLPRFWYLPHGEEAALVMTADDHGTWDGSARFFDRMLAASDPGCDVDTWECPRATTWLYPSTPLAADDARSYADAGFDIGVHVTTDCRDWTEASLDAAFVASVLDFRRRFPALPPQTGHRLHCIAYSDWLSLPAEQERWGMRLDMNYYHWPPDWVGEEPGYLTGSALPMRFSDVDGRMLNVFQQESHLVNETWLGSAVAIEGLIAAARDDRGYYGAFGTHFDFSDDFDRTLMEAALRLDVPMVSAQQLLEFTEGREASRFDSVVQTGAGDMSFDVRVDARVRGLLQGMLPLESGGLTLTSLTADGAPVDYEVRLVKGIRYAFFEAGDVHYEAAYR